MNAGRVDDTYTAVAVSFVGRTVTARSSGECSYETVVLVRGFEHDNCLINYSDLTAFGSS